MAKVNTQWNCDADCDCNDCISQQQSVALLTTATAWKSSHAPLHYSPMMSASLVQRCSTRQSARDQSPPLPALSIPCTRRNRKAPLYPSPIYKQISPSELNAGTPYYMPPPTTSSPPPYTPLSSKEMDALWMLPEDIRNSVLIDSRHGSLDGSVATANSEAPEKKAKSHGCFRKLFANSKRGIKQIWNHDDRSAWDYEDYRY